MYKIYNSKLGAVSYKVIVFTSKGIPMLKIRRSGCNMGIPITNLWLFYSKNYRRNFDTCISGTNRGLIVCTICVIGTIYSRSATNFHKYRLLFWLISSDQQIAFRVINIQRTLTAKVHNLCMLMVMSAVRTLRHSVCRIKTRIKCLIWIGWALEELSHPLSLAGDDTA